MAIRKPSGVPVSILLSYLEMEKTFTTIYTIRKLDDFFIKTDAPSNSTNSKLALLTGLTNCELYCNNLDLICQSV
jgi:hypothetical protein